MIKQYQPVAISVTLLVAYGLLVPTLGFYTSTLLYLVAHATYLGMRNWHLILGVTAGLLLVLYGVIEVFLNVALPSGALI